MAGWLGQRAYIARAEFHEVEAPGATCLADLERVAVGPEYRPAFTAPADPTDAAPGSPEKIEVMRRRHECGEHLWHPADARYASEGGGGDRFLAPTAFRFYLIKKGSFGRRNRGTLVRCER